MRTARHFFQAAFYGFALLAGLLLIGAACNKPDDPTGGPPPISVPPPEQPKPPAPDQQDLNRELEALHLLVQAHNKARSEAGAPALVPNTKLMAAAKYHANWMAANKKMSHEGNGTTPWQRISATGYQFTSAGENIAYGYRSPTSVMTGWLNSEGHRNNILNRNYTEVGLAVSVDQVGVPYWCVVFARPKTVGAAIHPDVSPHYPPAIFADPGEINDLKGFNNKP